MTEKIKKITSVLILLSLLSFYFTAPFTVKKADAFLGIADITFNTTLGDIPRYVGALAMRIAKYGLEKLRRRMLTQIQNDLVNWVQNGGEPRFVKDPYKFLKDNANTTAAKEIDKLFLSKNINICSPFRANVRFLVSRPLLLKEESVRCSLGDMVDNLEKFAQNFEDGGWTAWLKLHETRNTLPGSYLAATELIGAKVAQSGNAAQASLSAGKGFLDQKKCSEIKFPKYVIDFVHEIDGSNNRIEINNLKLLDQVLSVFEAPGWSTDWSDELWAQITPVPLLQVRLSSIEILTTGEFITQIHNLDDPIPPRATCSKEETVTPGSIIGDQISGVLEKTGIDNIINSNDIAQILNAVIDAAVNRAAREGLSYMKSGRGSWTVPKDRGAGAGAGAQQVLGLESSEAISLQNQLIDLQSAAQKLKLGIGKLTKRTNQDKFNLRLSGIAGNLQGDGSLSVGIVGKNLSARSEKDNGLSDIIDRLFDNYAATFLFGEVDGLSEDVMGLFFSKFPDESNFNKESNNPGVYAANMALNQKTADVWQAIAAVFSNLSGDTPYATKQSCKLIDYTLKPGIEEGGDNLPFINADGDNIHWSSKEDTYKKRIRKKAAALRTRVEDIKIYALNQSGFASAKQMEYQLKADSYVSLSENSGGIIEELEADMKFTQDNLPNIILYTSMLMDYDRAGQNHNLVQKIKTYHEALDDRKSLAGDLEKAYTDLRAAETATRASWLKTQRALATDSDTSVAKKATSKVALIGRANLAINRSWKNIFNSFEEDTLTGDPNDLIIDPTQLGTRAAQAVATVMDINIDGLRSEMEERQSRIGRQQTETSNRLGVFAEKGDIRKEIGLEGGDSEWEKYFENRFQLVYAAFIYDFYKNHFVKELCSDKPAGLGDEPAESGSD